MLLHILGYKTSLECLWGENLFIVSPKAFKCSCFVQAHQLSREKFEPHAHKYNFVWYHVT